MPSMIELAESGRRWLLPLSHALADADPRALVSPRSQLLCAGLGELSASAARALGATDDDAERCGAAGAALSLLTKIDDEVIDALSFHGGPEATRHKVADDTRAYLAPTLVALLEGARCPEGEPGEEAPRCRFARDVGRRFAALRPPAAPLERLLDAIAEGWEVQVSAAVVLTAHPDSVSAEDVARATRSISGAWLAMVTLVGGLAPSAERTLTENEIVAIWDFGSFIQRADALCDLEKDQRDGLASTFVAHSAFVSERKKAAATTALSRDLAATYRLVAEEGIDVACAPSHAERVRLAAALSQLGEVNTLLSWIFSMLFGRYLAHPLAARKAAMTNAEVTTCSAR